MRLIIKQGSTNSFGLFSDPKKCRSHSNSSWTNQIYQNKVVHRVSTNGFYLKVQFKLSLGAEKPQTAPLNANILIHSHPQEGLQYFT